MGGISLSQKLLDTLDGQNYTIRTGDQYPKESSLMEPIRNKEKKPKVGRYRISRQPSKAELDRYQAEAIAYFERRRKKLHVIATTTTKSGQTLDWIRPESQLPSGKLASPPPLQPLPAESGKRRNAHVVFELERDLGARGPEGTVPVLRKDLSKIQVRKSLRRYLSKLRGRGHFSLRSFRGMLAPPPEEGGTHRYANSSQSVLCLGGEGFLSVYDPYTETSDDFSLLQIGLINDEAGYIQSAEAGVQEMQDIYGDWVPHLFVYYTTNGYSNDDDNQGGYNQDVDGWVQYDSSVYPGATFSNLSTPDGTQYQIFIKYQFFEGNWWFRAGDRWLGYYPGSLYEGNRSVFSSLGDHANRIGFWGEVFDSDDNPGPTSTTMGSGYWAEEEWPWSAFQKNLKFQADRNGTMQDYNADGTVVDSPNMYDLEMHMLSDSDWGSYQWLGGPGAH